MRIKFDKEKATEWGEFAKAVLWNPEVMLGAGIMGGMALTNLIYAAVDARMRANVIDGERKFIDDMCRIWDDLPKDIPYGLWKIPSDDSNKLHYPLFFFLSEEDQETRDFAK